MIDFYSETARQIRADALAEIERIRDVLERQTTPFDQTQYHRGKINGLRFVVEKLSPNEDTPHA